jgi:beta-lactamase regulating signal transducer with metallopeptidase domain
MTGVIRTLLEITAYSGILFAIILALKKLLGRQLSASLHYLLWMLLVARLLMPVTIDSGLKLFVLPQEPAAAETTTPAGEQTTFDLKENTGVSAYATQPEVVQNTAAAAADGAVTASPPARVNVDWTVVAVSAWGFGILGYFAVIAWLHRRFCRLCRRGAVAAPGWVTEMAKGCAKELSIRRRIKVCVQDGLKSPALTLSLWPKLLLPQTMLSGMSREQTELGIRHELTHYKRGDHLMSLLLLVLRGVYWFNPLVWIAHKMMLADMEAACDARATMGLEKQRRNLYVSTVIDLGSDQYARCALGMGTGSGKKEMERRIRGMFMKRRSGRAARLTALLLVPLLLVACFTTACQPTPEKPIVVGKGQDLSDLVEAAPDVSKATSSPEGQTANTDALYDKLGVPKHWTMETQEMDGRLNIVADVDVELPAVDKLPAATAVLRAFSQQEIETVVKAVLGDGLTFTESVDFTKESLQAEILTIKQNLAEQEALMAAGEWPAKGSWYGEDSVKEYESRLADAPSESELKAKDLSIETLEDYDQTYQGIRVRTTVDGQTYVIRAGDVVLPEAVHSIRIATGGTYGAYFGGTYRDEPYGVALTKDEAAAQAQAIAAQLTDELKLCYVVPTATGKEETDRNWGWACVFMREINGCPTAYATEDVGSSMESEEQKPVRYEKMVIVMDDMGVISFKWENPMTVTSIDNADVAVLPFDEIAQAAVKQLAVRNKWSVENDEGEEVDPGCTVNVTRVELGLMRVMKADSAEYYYIPVWNFYSDVEHTQSYQDKWNKGEDYEEVMAELKGVDERGNPNFRLSDYPQAWGSVTINALNGSVIDRDKGY